MSLVASYHGTTAVCIAKYSGSPKVLRFLPYLVLQESETFTYPSFSKKKEEEEAQQSGSED